MILNSHMLNDKNKNTICAVPWMHLNFEPNGKVVPCCLTSTHHYYAGDLNEDSISKIWNSDNMKFLRRQMLDGERPEICRKCFNQEDVTGTSTRTIQNKEFPEVLGQIPHITKEDGTCTEMKLKYWDFRFSNLCNYKCRSCGPRYSSSWVPDAKKLGWLDKNAEETYGPEVHKKVWNIQSVDDLSNFEFLKDQVQHVKKIYFAGGEPLLMPEHWQILELLVQNKRFDVKISYNTNCSTLVYDKKDVLDYWKHWEDGKIEVWPSIDEIGDRAELIRSGTDWKKVEENLKRISSLENIIVRPGLTIGAWNVFRLPEIINHLIELGVVREKHKHTNFFINLLEQPENYHVQILPDEFKQSIIERLEKFIFEYKVKYKSDLSSHFTHILHELKKPFNSDAARKFLLISNQLNTVRNEDLFEIIPEMKVLINLFNNINE